MKDVMVVLCVICLTGITVGEFYGTTQSGKKNTGRIYPTTTPQTGGVTMVPLPPTECKNGGSRCGWEACCPGPCTCTPSPPTRPEDCVCDWQGRYGW